MNKLEELEKTLSDFDQRAKEIDKGPKKKRKWKRILLLGFLIINATAFIIPPFVHPIEGIVTSPYFIRRNPEGTAHLPLKERWELHKGRDIAAAAGTLISPSSVGLVKFAGTSPTYGNYVEIYHLLGFSTRYAHMKSLSVKKGKFVVPGISTIGTVGSTGRSTGNHLHFEVRFLSVPIPPGIVLFYHSLRKKVLGF